MFRPNARSPSITSQESYSAVMITDLIADVPVSVENEGCAKTAKEATNLAYDGQLENELSSAVNDANQKTNGSSISRGVLLNAVQFGKNDSKTPNDEKCIQLSSTLPVPKLTQEEPQSKSFKDMSLSRKIAFGFSFLPSILFVLCFAVILPCNPPKSCIEQIWAVKLNDTVATSGLEFAENVVFTALHKGESVLFQLNKINGKISEIKLDSNAMYLKCGRIMDKDKMDCITMDEHGKMYSIHDSNSTLLWEPVSEDKEISNPVVLSGCKDETNDVVFAVSSNTFKVLHAGDITSFEISECDSVPSRLMPWVVNGSPNIVFMCEKDGKDRLVRIPKSVWCSNSTDSQEKPVILETGALGSLKKSAVQPINDGIVVWIRNEVSMIQPNGSYLWQVSNQHFPEENRFILYGNFHGDNKQVAIFGSNLSTGLEVTLLDSTNGAFVDGNNFTNTEATQIIQVQGKTKDHIVLLLKKAGEDIVTRALTQIDDISTTVVSLVSNEDVNPVIQKPVVEKLALLDLDGDTEMLEISKNLEDGAYKSTITAVSNTDSGTVNIYLLSTSDRTKNTEVMNIGVDIWKKSTRSKCQILNTK